MHLPFALARRLRSLLLARLHPVLILLDPDYRVLEWEGELGCFGLQDLESRSDCRALLPVLHGMPLDETVDLEFVEAPNGGALNLQLWPVEGGAALLLTDVSDERDWRREVQQQANETKLLSQRQEKLLKHLKAARTELVHRQRLAEEANRLKSRFIASMSHEFHTPLASILGQVELLRGQKDESGLGVIEANAEHLLSLIDNILDQAKLESDQLVLSPQPTDLRRLGTEMESIFAPIAHKRGLVLRLYMSETLPQWVELDARCLRQVLINLLGNACKFTRVGQVRLKMDWSSDRLTVAVEDTGPGIPQAASERIFQPFYQEPGATTRGRDGVGLGLSISTRLVKLMGGVLSVEAREEKGARFVFYLSAPAIHILEVTTPAVGRRVLVADDSDDLRLLLVQHLKKDGYEVLEAGNETAVMSAFEQAAGLDLIIMDLYLGEADGADLARQIRRRGFAGAILILSASSTRKDHVRAMSAGCDAFLVKPVKAALLSLKVAELISAQRGRL